MDGATRTFGRIPCIGAVVGDIVGSAHETSCDRARGRTDFALFDARSHFTDDSAMTIAIASAVQKGYGDIGRTRAESVRQMVAVGGLFPLCGFGGGFSRWLRDPAHPPYGSWGNGSAMRVSAVGWAYDTVQEVEGFARATAEVSHNHPEGIKGAQAVALSILLARKAVTKEEIRRTVSGRYGYDLGRKAADIRRGYRFDVSCQGSVPEAIVAFLDSGDFEEAVRIAVSLGGDTDTQASIAGAIAQAYYGGVPEAIASRAYGMLAPELARRLDAWAEWIADRRAR